MRYALFSALGALVFAAGCAAPFSYAENRCTGSANRCYTSCTGVQGQNNGPARAACEARCRQSESSCSTGGSATYPSSLASEAGVSAARSQSEKERGYTEWKRRKEAERDGDKDDSSDND